MGLGLCWYASVWTGVYSVELTLCLRGEIVLTAAEFALFFEGANLEKRFVASPQEIKKSFPVITGQGLPAWESLAPHKPEP